MDVSSKATVADAPARAAPLAAPQPRLSRRALRMRQPSRRNYWLHVLGGGSLIRALQFGNPRLAVRKRAASAMGLALAGVFAA